MRSNLVSPLRLMLVTDDRLVAGRDLIALSAAAVRGGVTAVQLRLKEASPNELLRLARGLRAALPAAVPVVLNDRPDIAAMAGVGVHLGPDDLPVDLARRVMPPGLLIGASAGSPEEAERAGGADYWGVGPWRATGTKSDAGLAIGREGFQRVVARAGDRPCLAIGGVRPEDVPEVLAAGGAGVAVISGILCAPDVAAAARRYAEAFAPVA